jgi:glycosyltransferase involved in cell wall biosynthesis
MPRAAHTPHAAHPFLPERRALRIAVVTETYPPEVNGVAATIACVVDGLRARGHQVQLVRPRQHGGEGQSASAADVLLRGLPIPNYPQLKLGLPATRALMRLWAEAPPDIVHVVTEGPLGWSALRAARKLGLPVSSDFRTNFHAYGQHYGMAWLQQPLMGYLRHFHNRCDITMVPTESLRQQLAGEGLQRLRVVARGVDATLFHPSRRDQALRAAWGAQPDTPVVVHVGRIAAEKNLGVLWQAVQAMRQIDPRVLLVMVGDGPLRADCARLWRGAVFAGARTGADLAAHYASGDVFLFPSVTETFGNVTPEAMASGLAVLAYDYAAAGQLIRDRDNGLLARFDQPDAFVRQARRLAAQPSLVAALRQRAREAACRLAWPQVVGEMEGLFDALLRGAGQGADATEMARAA